MNNMNSFLILPTRATTLINLLNSISIEQSSDIMDDDEPKNRPLCKSFLSKLRTIKYCIS